MELEIIHGPYSQNFPIWGARADAVHQGTTFTAETGSHGVARVDAVRLQIRGDVVFTLYAGYVVIGQREIGRKHCCRNLATVRTITNEWNRIFLWIGHRLSGDEI